MGKFIPFWTETVQGLWLGGRRTSPEPLLPLEPRPQSPLRLLGLREDRRDLVFALPTASLPARKALCESTMQGVAGETSSSFMQGNTGNKPTNQKYWRRTAERDHPLDFPSVPRSKSTSFCQRRTAPELGGEEAAGAADASWKPTEHHGTRLRERRNEPQAHIHLASGHPDPKRDSLLQQIHPERGQKKQGASPSIRPRQRARPRGRELAVFSKVTLGSLMTHQGQHGRRMWRIQRERR